VQDLQLAEPWLAFMHLFVCATHLCILIDPISTAPHFSTDGQSIARRFVDFTVDVPSGPLGLVLEQRRSEPRNYISTFATLEGRKNFLADKVGAMRWCEEEAGGGGGRGGATAASMRPHHLLTCICHGAQVPVGSFLVKVAGEDASALTLDAVGELLHSMEHCPRALQFRYYQRRQ
jgi:hypothetical protein